MPTFELRRDIDRFFTGIESDCPRITPVRSAFPGDVTSVGSPLAIAGVLEAVERGDGKPLDEGLRAEAEIFGRLCATADKHEGLAAFLAKRPAVWQNH